jgi:hypothetical protein
VIRCIALVLLLAGCTAVRTSAPLPLPPLPDCPPAPAVPKPPPPVRDVDTLRQFEITLELAREAERSRGDACAARAAALEERQ